MKSSLRTGSVSQLKKCSGNAASLEGVRVYIEALGCRTNLAESEALASGFERLGAVCVTEPPFDAAVVVTCSVTSMADRKSRQIIRRIRRKAPDCILAVCGCWAQGIPSFRAEKIGVDILVGNRHKYELPAAVAGRIAEKRASSSMTVIRTEPEGGWDHLRLDRSPYKERAFIKIQDGCDHGCTYCIIPSLRGHSVSRPVCDILEEVERCSSTGSFEIILTGVHLGLFGRDTGTSFADLIRRIDAMDKVKRIRFGSLEPFCIDDSLLEALADSGKFCRHLHLPVQSGDDGVLRRMGRGHSAGDYLQLVRRLRDALGDDLHISSDVMCAFPGESEEAFSNTLALLDEARIGRVHGFRYSPRPGTPAASWRQVDSNEACDRMNRLIAAGDRCLEREAKRWLGRTVEVLFEGPSRGYSYGYSREYLEVRPDSDVKESIYNEMRIFSVKHCDNGVLFVK